MEGVYVAVGWPQVQDFMLDLSTFKDVVGFDPRLNLWFVPKELYDKTYESQD